MLPAVDTRALDLLARPPRVGGHPLLREHPTPRSDRRFGAMPGLQKRKKSMRLSIDTGEWIATRI